MSILVILFIFSLSLYPVSDTDVGWHLRTGEYIFNTNSIPNSYLFSFTTVNIPYIHYSWLAELLIFLSYKLFGLTGISLLYATILSLTILILAKTCLLTANKKLSWLFFVFLTPLAHTISGGRTIVFGSLFLAIVYYLLKKNYKHGSKTIWLTPIIFTIWTNFHASFVVGLLILGTTMLTNFFSSRQRQTISKTSALALISLSAIATLITPHTYEVWTQIVFKTFSQLSNIQEFNPTWRSPIFQNVYLGFSYLFAALCTILLILRLSWIPKFQKNLFVILLILTLYSSRFLFALLIISTPIAYEVITQLLKNINDKKIEIIPLKILSTLSILIIVLLVLNNLVLIQFSNSSSENYTRYLANYSPNKKLYEGWSQKGYDFLKSNYKDKKILTDANWSGLLILENPSSEVFYYSAMDNYTINNKPFALKYLETVNGLNNWQNNLNLYNVEVVFLPKTYNLTQLLKNQVNWQKAYTDTEAEIFIKD